MSRRRRGILFAVTSALAALIAAATVSRHEQSFDAGAGELRGILVARTTLEPGAPIEAADLALRRFPASFVPAQVLSLPSQVIGLEAAAAVPAGAYLLPAMLAPRERRRREIGRDPGGVSGTPVEVGIVGGGALRGAGGARVDVLVTRDSPRGLGGSTRVSVVGARLLALESAGAEPAESTATLAVRRSDALRLIEADSYAREIRLIATRRSATASPPRQTDSGAGAPSPNP